jgi:ElaB/YqjD/DUF883 family membrane-anchored ribosome-binding protein
MAQKPDEIERDIEARRQVLHARVREMRERAQGDVDTMRGAVKDRVDTYTGKVDDVKEKALEQVDEHPFLSLAGGFGLGFALGIAAPDLSLGRPASNGHGGNGNNARDDDEKGILGSALGSLMGVVTGQLMQEVRGKVQEQVSDLVHSGPEKDRQPAQTRAA